MGLIVKISTVSDGSMYNRKDFFDADVITNRAAYLSKNGLDSKNAIRLNTNANKRAEIEHETNWCRYAEVDSSSAGSGMEDGNAPVADGLVTKESGVILLLPIADCVGTTIYDPEHHLVMLSHLGRHSLEQQGGTKSVKYLVDTYRSDPGKLLVWLTPAPNKEVFPIWALDNKGMKEVAFEQLQAAGISLNNITDNPADTATDLNYYSYSEYLKGHRDEDGDYSMIAILAD